MKISTTTRILRDTCLGRSPREHYWEACRCLGEIGGLLLSRNRHLRRVVLANHAQFLFGRVKPVQEQTTARAEAAAAWLMRAQDATADGGISYGYFPASTDAGWDVSYPETTGYIMTSLLEYGRRFHDASVLDRVMRMANWEIEIQMPNGAVQGGKLCPPERQTVAAFNTGMVLDGWVSVYRTTGDEGILEAARRAADFLLADISDEGYFRSNGAFVSADEIKVYNCLCGWALYRLGVDTGETRYQQAAVRSVEAAVRKQQPNGWFADNCLTRHEAPLLHTIGYTLQGVMEVGLLAGREDFIAAVCRGADPLVDRIAESGFLYGRYYDDWEPAVFSSCLTGSAQFAIVCYRLAQHRGDGRYCEAADRIVDYLKALQVMESNDPAVNGALAGSFPIFGSYMPGGYPNWATKYFLDALMLQLDTSASKPVSLRASTG